MALPRREGQCSDAPRANDMARRRCNRRNAPVRRSCRLGHSHCPVSRLVNLSQAAKLATPQLNDVIRSGTPRDGRRLPAVTVRWMAFTSTLSRPMSWGTVEGKLIAYFCRKGWLGGIWDEISGISSNSLDSHPQNRRVNLVGLADPGGRAGRVIREGYHALESISAPTSSKNTLKAWTHLGTFAFRCLSCIVRHKKAGWSDRTRVSPSRHVPTARWEKRCATSHLAAYIRAVRLPRYAQASLQGRETTTAATLANN